MKYTLLGRTVEIPNIEGQSYSTILHKFILDKEQKSNSVTLQIAEAENIGYGIEKVVNRGKAIHNIFFSQKDGRQILCAFDKEYSDFLLSVRGDCSQEVFLELFMAAFYSYISLHHALLMHASCVSYENQGIVFTASSGVGKTTQAELWAEHMGAKILNGDKVFLKRENDGIHAWGSPWKGSSPYAENESAPLKAIVVLEQAEENSIQKLEGLDVLEHVIPHVFFPSWDTNCEQAVLTFLDQVLAETEIYLLKCRPDETAVELLASVTKE